MSLHRALLRRRNDLARVLGNQPALVASGAPRPRNYAANAHRFRAASHFLYLVGWNTPGAVLLYDGQGFKLFAPLPGPDDALWEGAALSPVELGEKWGLDVVDISALPGHLPRGPIATLPGLEGDTCAAQSAWLGRPIIRGALAPCDEPLADAMITLRLIQDDAMLTSVREALKITTRCHLAGMAATSAGIPEAHVRAAMEAPMLAANVEPAYGSIVTCHGEVLHNTRYDHILAAEDLLLADVGAESPDGVASDITRTWPVSGTFSPEAADLYDVVLAAQARAIAAVAPGRRYRDIHLEAMQALAEGLVAVGLLQGDPAERVADDSVALFFPHGIGHLLGLDVHDMEDLGDRAGYATGRTRDMRPGLRYLRLDRDLAPGMMVTIEPGLYFVPALLEEPETRRKYADRIRWSLVDRFARVRGIRIEDDVLVTATGHEVLSAAIPKDRASVEKAVTATPG
jgi:Xaa-Pro aminopeptidase